MHEQYVPGCDGARLWCSRIGEGPGVPLVCCNGLGMSADFWRHAAEYFKDRHPVILWEYRGHHRSERPRDLARTSVVDNAKDLVAVMDALGVEGAVLLGHSMGCQIILEAYRLYPERVLGLVPMMGTFERPLLAVAGGRLAVPFPILLGVVKRTLPAWSAALRGLTSLPGMAAVARCLVLHPYLASPQDVAAYLRMVREVDFDVFLAMFAHLQQHSARRYLADIRAPLLVVAGELDRFTPPEQAFELIHLTPESELLFLEQGTHLALAEQPDLINLRLERFLAKHFANFAQRDTGR